MCYYNYRKREKRNRKNKLSNQEVEICCLLKNGLRESWKKKNIIANCRPYIESIDCVVKETEKAVLLQITFAYTNDIIRTRNEWVPKSCTITEEEKKIEEQESERRFEEGCKKYEELLKFAKANLKGIRKGMRKDTIIKKLNDAGIEYVW